ncbi:sphingomyelin phosphodiesterase 2 [Trichonephila clavipes]|nr:sphingomyelin phosphodiesterase 2 [Trichonephila clavipes]
MSEPVSLPADRVKDANAFDITAIHLELVSSLSTECFMLSLRRFIARRTRPETIYTDNGTNFVGTNSELKNLDWDKIMKETDIKPIKWKFNPPTAAWWGGWWERLVRVIKELLKRTLVVHHGLKINLYVTHLHAEYDAFHDQYLPHRVAQAFEFSQYVRHTSETADLSIVAGDFNTEPTDLPYKIIVHNSGCVDSYTEQKNPPVVEDTCIRTTCGHPDNIYTSSKELNHSPAGKRIDYILYKCSSGTYVECLTCETPLDRIPDTTIPYSDHEAVVAQLHVFKSMDAPPQPENFKCRLDAIDKSQLILGKSAKELQNSRLMYILLSCLLLALLMVTTLIDDIGVNIAIIYRALFKCIIFQIFITLVLAKTYFKEEFSDDKWEKQWTPSEHPGKEWGTFVLTHGKFYGDQEISKGIQTSQDASILTFGLSVVETKLGNTVIGMLDDVCHIDRNVMTTLSMYVRNFKLTDLWSLESLGISNPTLEESKQNSYEDALNDFQQKLTILHNGRYELQLPWKHDPVNLPDNKGLTWARHEKVIKRAESNGFLGEYQKVFEDWENLGYYWNK